MRWMYGRLPPPPPPSLSFVSVSSLLLLICFPAGVFRRHSYVAMLGPIGSCTGGNSFPVGMHACYAWPKLTIVHLLYTRIHCQYCSLPRLLAPLSSVSIAVLSSTAACSATHPWLFALLPCCCGLRAMAMNVTATTTAVLLLLPWPWLHCHDQRSISTPPTCCC